MTDLIDFVIEPMQFGFMVRALVVSVLVGIICPVVGSYVVIRGLAFMGDALAHAILPGVVVAFLLGISPIGGAVITALGVAFLIGFISRKTGVSEDTSIGILFAGLFALGIVLLSVSKEISVDLEDLLLGQVLGVSMFDVWATLALVTVVLVVLYGFHKELVFSSFDPVGATVIGLPTGALTYLLLVLLALVIVVALQAVGIVLVMAMLVTPAATGYILVKRFLPVMFVGAMIGAASAVVGLYASYYLNVPSGAAIVLVATGIFAVASVTKRGFA